MSRFSHRGSLRKTSDMGTAYFCKRRVTITERETDRRRLVYRISLASRRFPCVIRAATQRDRASSMPAEVREKQSA